MLVIVFKFTSTFQTSNLTFYFSLEPNFLVQFNTGCLVFKNGWDARRDKYKLNVRLLKMANTEVQ